MLGKKCRLCGGRLANKRCVLCGLDQSVYDRKPPIYEDEANSETQNAQFAQGTRQRDLHKGQWRPITRKQRERDPQQKASIGIRLLPLVILLAVVICFVWGFVSTNLSNNTEASDATLEESATTGGEVDAEEFLEEIAEVESDPYRYVTREISDEGSSFETVLGNGTYMVGVHVPEGIYEVEIVEGSGIVEITDYENNIFDFISFGSETEDSAVVESADDVRLYNGAILQVYSGAILRFSTENAQELEQELEENPLTESVSLEVGSYTADEDTIPEGIYDITVTEDEDADSIYAMVTLVYPNGRYEYVWVYTASYAPVSDEYDEIGAKNIVIPEGTEVVVEYGGITLTPSEDYYDVDYTMYTEE